MSTIAAEDRAKLKVLLRERSFLESSSGENLSRRNGSPVPWVFYGPAVSLTHEGSTLIASAFLDRLRSFQSTQLATYGTSAISILASIVSLGKGRYSGLTVRREKKPYGACRRVDGPLDRTRPVVVIDESISSGWSLQSAISALESEGFTVEGAIGLVEFSGYESVRWLAARGYRIETIFDVWGDLDRLSGSPPLGADKIEPRWGSARLPDGLSPAEVARAAAVEYQTTLSVPLPPFHLDRYYDSSGGTYLSIRRIADDFRLIREGFRRGQGDDAHAGRDVLLAAWKALSSPWLKRPLDLTAVKFGVSFMSAPEPISPAEIDPQNYALVLKGSAPLNLLGFALPNTPHYHDENEQYHYARSISTNFWKSEPEAIFRQRVERAVEPGHNWPSSGATPVDRRWITDKSLADALALRATAVLRHILHGDRLPESPIFSMTNEPTYGLGVSLYLRGLVGCTLNYSKNLDEALLQAIAAAFNDKRFGAENLYDHSPEDFNLVVSLLYQRQYPGYVAKDRMKRFFRVGRDTLMASGEGKSGLVLAHFAASHSLDADTYVTQVLQKAGLAANHAYWTSFETASWLISNGKGERLVRGIPARDDAPASEREHCIDAAKLLANYVFKQRCDDGLPAYFLRTCKGSRYPGGTATRVLLAVTGLLRARPLLDSSAAKPIASMAEAFVQGEEPGSPRKELNWDEGSDAQLLTNISLLENRRDYGRQALILAERLRRMIRVDGAIYATAASSRMSADLDFLSGSALLALASASRWMPHVFDEVDLERVLCWYRRRFSLVHPWGMVWWHGQCWTELSDRVEGAQAFVFEIIDWALRWQTKASGSFIINLEPHQNSFLSACVLEAVADAWKLAIEEGIRIGQRAIAAHGLRGWRFSLA